MPGYEMDKRNPPQPDESTARFLGNDSTSTDPSIMPFNILGYEDSFFQAVVWGFEGTPIEELVGEENVPRVLEKAERTYRQIIAQNLNEYFRIPESTTSAGSSFNATITDSSELRLVQNAVSTRLLEGILLFMAICAGVSFFLERSTQILPKNPASIASAMSLFADSDFLQIVSQELSMPDGEKRLHDGILKESRFRLGWWDMGTARERFGIDIERPGESHLQIDDQENSISLLNIRRDDGAE
ncbi:hypothetical protein DBV05_g12288 [Lasiodiplodia theobromae]|uniref:Uncharacterized protein n=1 Tax=Lasiodiplodia theobromae TaxID=45133 RepID=A0A5N5CUK9_9PEZI|nr:hypothetical protein DBV05_g12288 [Lasiodiplodia theobromae]